MSKAYFFNRLKPYLAQNTSQGLRHFNDVVFASLVYPEHKLLELFNKLEPDWQMENVEAFVSAYARAMKELREWHEIKQEITARELQLKQITAKTFHESLLPPQPLEPVYIANTETHPKQEELGQLRLFGEVGENDGVWKPGLSQNKRRGGKSNSRSTSRTKALWAAHADNAD